MVLLHKNSGDQKGFKYLQAGLDSLEGMALFSYLKPQILMKHLLGDTRTARASPSLLPDLISKRHWRGEILCYFRLYMAFYWAGVADWAKTKRYIDDLRTTAETFEISLAGPLWHLMMYLDGVYHQGIGDFDTALQIFGDAKFNITIAKHNTLTSADQVERDIALLAALNTLWIVQDKPRLNPDQNMVLMERLEPFCANHPNQDIRTAFNLIMATVETNPPSQLFKVKSYLRLALDCAQATANTQFLAITLSVMCSRFFNNVVGAQAEKSARAASVQATKCGNVLWMSVADGMLARCYEVQGKKEEAKSTLEQARMYSDLALPDI
jgi:hypothetical protein